MTDSTMIELTSQRSRGVESLCAERVGKSVLMQCSLEHKSNSEHDKSLLLTLDLEQVKALRDLLNAQIEANS